MEAKKETEEERRQRHAKKAERVEKHRQQVLKQVNKQASGAAGRSALHKKEDFVCPIVFDNTLPELPCEQKFVAYPFDEDLLTAFDVLHGVSSETAIPRTYHPEPDLDIGINLMDPVTYTIPSADERPPLHPIDAEITSKQYARPAQKRGDTFDHAKVEWLMLSQHLHNDLYDAVYKHGDIVSTQQMHLDRKRQQLAAQFGGSRQERIEASFAACGPDQPLVHPTNPKLQPKRVWEVLPDPVCGGANFVAVGFDLDPDDSGERKIRKLPPLQPGQKRARLERAVIRTPATQPVDLRENTTMVNFLLPLPEDAEAAAASESGIGAASSSSSSSSSSQPLRLEGVREYAMVVDRAERQGEDTLAWAWDDVNATIHFVPIKARALLTRVQSRSAAAAASGEEGGIGAQRIGVVTVDAVAHRRPLAPSEEDDMAAWRAVVDEVDPRQTLEDIAGRKRQRVDAAKEAAAAAASAGGGSSSAAGGRVAASTMELDADEEADEEEGDREDSEDDDGFEKE